MSGFLSDPLQRTEAAAAHQDRSWLPVYIGVMAGGFITLYVLTRSSILIAGGQAWIDSARDGNPAWLHYAEPGHFLQVVLSRLIWVTLERLGLPVSLDSLFLGMSLVGTIAAIVFMGLIAGQILQTRTAAWLAALLFGTSLLVWTQVNGELSGLALGCVTAALFLTLRGYLVLPALLWAMAVLAHLAFALAALAFILAVWMARPAAATTRDTLRRALILLLVSGTTTVLILLLGSWMVGKWIDMASLIQWLRQTSESRDVAHLDPVRAIKGLVTAFTVGGHYWRDIVTGRGPWTNPLFVPAAAVGLLVLATTAICIAVSSVCERRVALFALVWLLPSHILLNWRFAPAVEKHHAAALPGFVLLVIAGLIFIGERMSARGRHLLYGGFISACTGLNLFGALLPMQALGRDTDAAERAIRMLNDDRGGKAVFVSCDASRPIVRAGVRYLRIRSIWKGPPADVQAAIVSWTRARIAEGAGLYVLDRWCLPEQWTTPWSRDPFDLFFLNREFALVPTSITNVPVGEEPATNPFAFRTGDVTRIVLRNEDASPIAPSVLR